MPVRHSLCDSVALQDKIADAGGYGKEVRRPSCL